MTVVVNEPLPDQLRGKRQQATSEMPAVTSPKLKAVADKFHYCVDPLQSGESVVFAKEGSSANHIAVPGIKPVAK